MRSEINLRTAIFELWDSRKYILKWLLIGLGVGMVVVFSLPKEYKTKVSLAPEDGSTTMDRSMTLLAGLGAQQNTEALSPMIYPEIVKSTPFLWELLEMDVTDSQGKFNGSLYDYMEYRVRSPWWISVVRLPLNIYGKIRTSMKSASGENPTQEQANKTFLISPDQERVLIKLSDRIQADINKINGAATISVRLQDPMISAVVADSAVHLLQRYITDYRTNRSREYLEFTESVYRESKLEYIEAQSNYAQYVDRNHNVILQTHRATEERLRNEMLLAYGIYNQSAQTMVAARNKVQEITPVFALIEPARVLNFPSSPSSVMIFFISGFLGLLFSSFWVLLGRDFFKRQKTPPAEGEFE